MGIRAVVMEGQPVGSDAEAEALHLGLVERLKSGTAEAPPVTEFFVRKEAIESRGDDEDVARIIRDFASVSLSTAFTITGKLRSLLQATDECRVKRWETLTPTPAGGADSPYDWTVEPFPPAS